MLKNMIHSEFKKVAAAMTPPANGGVKGAQPPKAPTAARMPQMGTGGVNPAPKGGQPTAGLWSSIFGGGDKKPEPAPAPQQNDDPLGIGFNMGGMSGAIQRRYRQ